ncbi:unnamed protein product [Porites evermanni]|uniref:Uncharacterized protein n=1 Tax=Porites evermanni TaxID=104178 RepID=A0ABN8T4S9_9CNID|nr:unnamed protein product [Porites evermanni]
MCFVIGVRVGFFRGDIKLLLEDIQELKPTIFPSVPRLLGRIYDKLLNEHFLREEWMQDDHCGTVRFRFWLSSHCIGKKSIPDRASVYT